jgi:predicted enzyme related to lactoylglutathione lyase
MKRFVCLIFLLISLALNISANDFELRTYGLKINVDEMDKAVSFYVGKLGFEIEDRSNYPNQVSLKTNDRIKLILNKVKKLQKIDATDTRIGLTLQVNDLDVAIARMKAAGLDFGENQKRKEGVGNAISFNDPFGRTISIMHVTIVKVEPFKEPKVYNYGVLVPDMDIARDFYGKKLGFVERSERYLPLDMPLGHADKSFGFMLHVRPNVKSVKNEYPKTFPAFTMLFETSDLSKATAEIKSKGVKIIEKKKSVIFEDSFGNISEIVESKK